MTLSVTVTRSGRNPASSFRWSEAAAAWTRQAAPMAKGILRAHTPVGQGKGAGTLRQSISDRTEMGEGSAMVIFYSTVPYAKYVIGGTRPHVITPVNARALRWLGKGGIGVTFAKRVNHPGTKPNPFPERAMEVIQPALSHMFAAAVQEAMDL